MAFLVTALITIWGIRVYTRIRSTPLYIVIPLFLAVYIPCSIVVLVPIDLASSSEGKAFFYLSKEVRLVLWRVIYWLAFFLTWAILPLLQGYVDSGYHGTARKIKDSFHQNARYQLILLVVGSLGLIYVVLSSGLTFGSIKALAIALSHSYALVIALWLMGHGLVNIPRRSWVEADSTVKLKHFYQQATQANDMIAEAQSDYADIAAEVFALGPYKDNTRYTSWIESLLEAVEAGPGIPFSGSTSTGTVTGRSRVQIERSMINEDYLSTLNSRFKTARNRLIRYDADWQKLLREASRAEDVIRSRESKSLVFRFKKTPLPPRAAYYYYSVIKPQMERFFSIIFVALTVIIVWSEITHGTILSVVNLAISKTTGFWQQLLASLFLGYMCASSLSSLSRIRIFKVYALVYRHSDPSSMLFYAMYACRLTVPLSFNFITLITSRESVFEEFLGQYINLTPLGKYFNDWLPRFILVPMLITTFHVYDRIRDYFGFGLSFDDEEDVDDDGRPVKGSAVEGKHLIRRALTDTNYRYALRHPNIAVAAASVAGSNYNSGNDSSSSLINTSSRSSLEREGQDQRSSRTSLSHVSQLGLHRQMQLGGRNINRTRAEDQDVYSDRSPPNERRALVSESGIDRNNNDEVDNLDNDESIDSKVKTFFSSIGERFKSLTHKNSDINDGGSAGNSQDGPLPRWRQRQQQSGVASVENQYQDSDDDDDDDLPVTL